MLESLLVDVLSQRLGLLLLNIEREQLKLRSWKGNITLHNLQVRPDALDFLFGDLPCPIRVVRSHIGKLDISVPWKNLKSEPTVVTINSLHIVLQPAGSFSPDEHSRLKRRVLVNAEGNRIAARQQSIGGKPASGEGTSKFSMRVLQSVVSRILEKITVQVDDIHIRLEGVSTSGGVKEGSDAAYACGITLKALKLCSEPSPRESSDKQFSYILKRLTLSEVGAYWQSSPTTAASQSGTPATVAQPSSAASTPPPDPGKPRNSDSPGSVPAWATFRRNSLTNADFVLSPLSATARLSIRRDLLDLLGDAGLGSPALKRTLQSPPMSERASPTTPFTTPPTPLSKVSLAMRRDVASDAAPTPPSTTTTGGLTPPSVATQKATSPLTPSIKKSPFPLVSLHVAVDDAHCQLEWKQYRSLLLGVSDFFLLAQNHREAHSRWLCGERRRYLLSSSSPPSQAPRHHREHSTASKTTSSTPPQDQLPHSSKQPGVQPSTEATMASPPSHRSGSDLWRAAKEAVLALLAFRRSLSWRYLSVRRRLRSVYVEHYECVLPYLMQMTGQPKSSGGSRTAFLPACSFDASSLASGNAKTVTDAVGDLCVVLADADKPLPPLTPEIRQRFTLLAKLETVLDVSDALAFRTFAEAAMEKRNSVGPQKSTTDGAKPKQPKLRSLWSRNKPVLTEDEAAARSSSALHHFFGSPVEETLPFLGPGSHVEVSLRVSTVQCKISRAHVSIAKSLLAGVKFSGVVAAQSSSLHVACAAAEMVDCVSHESYLPRVVYSHLTSLAEVAASFAAASESPMQRASREFDAPASSTSGPFLEVLVERLPPSAKAFAAVSACARGPVLVWNSEFLAELVRFWFDEHDDRLYLALRHVLRRLRAASSSLRHRISSEWLDKVVGEADDDEAVQNNTVEGRGGDGDGDAGSGNRNCGPAGMASGCTSLRLPAIVSATVLEPALIVTVDATHESSPAFVIGSSSLTMELEPLPFPSKEEAPSSPCAAPPQHDTSVLTEKQDNLEQISSNKWQLRTRASMHISDVAEILTSVETASLLDVYLEKKSECSNPALSVLAASPTATKPSHKGNPNETSGCVVLDPISVQASVGVVVTLRAGHTHLQAKGHLSTTHPAIFHVSPRVTTALGDVFVVAATKLGATLRELLRKNAITESAPADDHSDLPFFTLLPSAVRDDSHTTFSLDCLPHFSLAGLVVRFSLPVTSCLPPEPVHTDNTTPTDEIVDMRPIAEFSVGNVVTDLVVQTNIRPHKRSTIAVSWNTSVAHVRLQDLNDACGPYNMVLAIPAPQFPNTTEGGVFDRTGKGYPSSVSASDENRSVDGSCVPGESPKDGVIRCSGSVSLGVVANKLSGDIEILASTPAVLTCLNWRTLKGLSDVAMPLKTRTTVISGLKSKAKLANPREGHDFLPPFLRLVSASLSKHMSSVSGDVAVTSRLSCACQSMVLVLTDSRVLNSGNNSQSYMDPLLVGWMEGFDSHCTLAVARHVELVELFAALAGSHDSPLECGVSGLATRVGAALSRVPRAAKVLIEDAGVFCPSAARASERVLLSTRRNVVGYQSPLLSLNFRGFGESDDASLSIATCGVDAVATLPVLRDVMACIRNGLQRTFFSMRTTGSENVDDNRKDHPVPMLHEKSAHGVDACNVNVLSGEDRSEPWSGWLVVAGSILIETLRAFSNGKLHVTADVGPCAFWLPPAVSRGDGCVFVAWWDGVTFHPRSESDDAGEATKIVRSVGDDMDQAFSRSVIRLQNLGFGTMNLINASKQYFRTIEVDSAVVQYMSRLSSSWGWAWGPAWSDSSKQTMSFFSYSTGGVSSVILPNTSLTLLVDGCSGCKGLPLISIAGDIPTVDVRITLLQCNLLFGWLFDALYWDWRTVGKQEPDPPRKTGRSSVPHGTPSTTAENVFSWTFPDQEIIRLNVTARSLSLEFVNDVTREPSPSSQASDETHPHSAGDAEFVPGIGENSNSTMFFTICDTAIKGHATTRLRAEAHLCVQEIFVNGPGSSSEKLVGRPTDTLPTLLRVRPQPCAGKDDVDVASTNARNACVEVTLSVGIDSSGGVEAVVAVLARKPLVGLSPSAVQLLHSVSTHTFMPFDTRGAVLASPGLVLLLDIREPVMCIVREDIMEVSKGSGSDGFSRGALLFAANTAYCKLQVSRRDSFSRDAHRIRYAGDRLGGPIRPFHGQPVKFWVAVDGASVWLADWESISSSDSYPAGKVDGGIRVGDTRRRGSHSGVASMPSDLEDVATRVRSRGERIVDPLRLSVSADAELFVRMDIFAEISQVDAYFAPGHFLAAYEIISDLLRPALSLSPSTSEHTTSGSAGLTSDHPPPPYWDRANKNSDLRRLYAVAAEPAHVRLTAVQESARGSLAGVFVTMFDDVMHLATSQAEVREETDGLRELMHHLGDGSRSPPAVPVLRFALPRANFVASDWSSRLMLYFDGVAECYLRNPALASWEPLLESWPFELQLKRWPIPGTETIGSGGASENCRGVHGEASAEEMATDAILSSHARMELAVPSAAIEEIIARVVAWKKTSFAREKAPDGNPRKLARLRGDGYAPLVMCNETGFEISLFTASNPHPTTVVPDWSAHLQAGSSVSSVQSSGETERVSAVPLELRETELDSLQAEFPGFSDRFPVLCGRAGRFVISVPVTGSEAAVGARTGESATSGDGTAPGSCASTHHVGESAEQESNHVPVLWEVSSVGGTKVVRLRSCHLVQNQCRTALLVRVTSNAPTSPSEERVGCLGPNSSYRYCVIPQGCSVSIPLSITAGASIAAASGGVKRMRQDSITSALQLDVHPVVSFLPLGSNLLEAEPDAEIKSGAFDHAFPGKGRWFSSEAIARDIIDKYGLGWDWSDEASVSMQDTATTRPTLHCPLAMTDAECEVKTTEDGRVDGDHGIDMRGQLDVRPSSPFVAVFQVVTNKGNHFRIRRNRDPSSGSTYRPRSDVLLPRLSYVTCVFRPPLIVENWLPTPLSFRVQSRYAAPSPRPVHHAEASPSLPGPDTDSSSTESSVVKSNAVRKNSNRTFAMVTGIVSQPGGYEMVHTVTMMEGPIIMAVCVPGYEWSQDVLQFHSSSEEKEEEEINFHVPDGYGGILELQRTVMRQVRGVCRIAVRCRYVIQNAVGLHMRYGHGAAGGDDVRLAAGQCPKASLPADATNPLTATPFLFSGVPKGRKFLVGIASRTFTKPVDLDAAGLPQQIDLPSLPNAGSTLYAVTATVSLAKGQGLAKTVRLTPRHVLCNVGGGPFLLSQPQSHHATLIQPGDRVPWHWTDAMKPKLLCLRPAVDGWGWSAPIPLEGVGEFHLKSIDERRTHVRFISVEIIEGGEEASFVVLIGAGSSDFSSSIRIDNASRALDSTSPVCNVGADGREHTDNHDELATPSSGTQGASDDCADSSGTCNADSGTYVPIESQSPPPFLLQNETPEILYIRQKRMKSVWSVSGSSTMPYAWDAPTGSPILVFSTSPEFSSKHEISATALGTCKAFYVRDVRVQESKYVTCSVNGDGPVTTVVRFMTGDVTSQDEAAGQPDEQEPSAYSRFTLSLSGIGVSFIMSPSFDIPTSLSPTTAIARELGYVSLINPRVELQATKRNEEKAQIATTITIKQLQVDNCRVPTRFPVIMFGPGSKDAVVRACLILDGQLPRGARHSDGVGLGPSSARVHTTTRSEGVSVKVAALSINGALEVCADDVLVADLIRLSTAMKQRVDNTMSDVPVGKSRSLRAYVELLLFQPIRIRVIFKPRNRNTRAIDDMMESASTYGVGTEVSSEAAAQRKETPGANVLWIVDTLGRGVGSFDTTVKLETLVLEHVRTGVDVLVAQILRDYRRKVMWELYKVVGGVEAVGRPAAVFRHLASGVGDLIQDSAKALRGLGFGSSVPSSTSASQADSSPTSPSKLHESASGDAKNFGERMNRTFGAIGLGLGLTAGSGNDRAGHPDDQPPTPVAQPSSFAPSSSIRDPASASGSGGRIGGQDRSRALPDAFASVFAGVSQLPITLANAITSITKDEHTIRSSTVRDSAVPPVSDAAETVPARFDTESTVKEPSSRNGPVNLGGDTIVCSSEKFGVKTSVSQTVTDTENNSNQRKEKVNETSHGDVGISPLAGLFKGVAESSAAFVSGVREATKPHTKPTDCQSDETVSYVSHSSVASSTADALASLPVPRSRGLSASSFGFAVPTAHVRTRYPRCLGPDGVLSPYDHASAKAAFVLRSAALKLAADAVSAAAPSFSVLAGSSSIAVDKTVENGGGEGQEECWVRQRRNSSHDGFLILCAGESIVSDCHSDGASIPSAPPTALPRDTHPTAHERLQSENVFEAARTGLSSFGSLFAKSTRSLAQPPAKKGTTVPSEDVCSSAAKATVGWSDADTRAPSEGFSNTDSTPVPSTANSTARAPNPTIRRVMRVLEEDKMVGCCDLYSGAFCVLTDAHIAILSGDYTIEGLWARQRLISVSQSSPDALTLRFIPRTNTEQVPKETVLEVRASGTTLSWLYAHSKPHQGRSEE